MLYVGMSDYLFTRLQVVQNAAAKLICNKSKFSSVSFCMKELHWLPIRQIASFKLMCHAHRTLYKTGPQILQGKLNFHVPTRDLRSRYQARATIKCTTKAKMGNRSFSKSAVVLWNKLPLELRLTEDYLTFRKKLKTHLFPRYWFTKRIRYYLYCTPLLILALQINKINMLHIHHTYMHSTCTLNVSEWVWVVTLKRK